MEMLQKMFVKRWFVVSLLFTMTELKKNTRPKTRKCNSMIETTNRSNIVPVPKSRHGDEAQSGGKKIKLD